MKKSINSKALRIKLGLASALAVFVGLIMAAGASWFGESAWACAAIGLLGAAGAFLAGASGRI